jgi:glycosyltransferase involved in cell wall biosynthesis
MRIATESRQQRFLLSILVCSLPSRVGDSFPKLIIELNRQCNGRPVQLLYLGDNRSMSVGEKRNRLLALADGDYTVFVDDDDMVPEYYVKEILDAIPSGSDVITIKALKTEMINGQEIRLNMDFSLRYGKNFRDSGILCMVPNHTCIIKRELSQVVRFENRNLSEDHLWAEKIFLSLKSETKIDKIMYYYKFDKSRSETQGR